MESISGIYKIVNTFNGKIYVGSSADIEKRWSIHKRNLKNKKHHCIFLQRAWDKYGEETFALEILETCEKALLFQSEKNGSKN